MILGVCGKIASGKSEVLKILKQKGFYCISADKVSHDLYEPDGEGAKRIAAVFGTQFLGKDGAVDRIKLRNQVFEDENKLKLLNNIIHPIVFEEIGKLIKRHSENNIAIEAVYFDENYLLDFVDKIVWIERSKEQILQSLIKERGLEEDVALKMYEQILRPLKVDFIIENFSNRDSLKKEIEKFLKDC